MLYLRNNIAVIIIAAVASVLVWLFGGTRGDLLIPVVPWLLVFLLEALVCFPQREPDESSYDARERVWKALKRDPLVWLTVAFIVLLCVPFANNGLCVICDAQKIREGLSPKPPLPFLPFCVDRMDHLNVVLWFAPALLMMIAAKHALTRDGKRLLLKFIVWNGVAVAFLGFLQEAMDAPGPFWNTDAGRLIGKPGDFFASFGYPNMAGDYFTVLMGLAVALWRQNILEQDEEEMSKDKSSLSVKPINRFWNRHFFLIPAVIFFFAAMNTLSRAAILLATASAVVYFVHAFISFQAHKHRAQKLRSGVWTLLSLCVVFYAAVMFMPSELQREVDTIGTTEVLDRVTGRGQYHTRVATAIWKDNKLFGCGGWGYIHFCVPKMTPEEYRNIQMIGGINVHNDYLQFLAEHGLVGLGLLVTFVVLLMIPVGHRWRRLASEARFITDRKQRPPSPVQLFVLPAGAFCLLVALLCTLIHAFGDCPLRSPAVLSLFFLTLASIPGFLPASSHKR